MSYTYNGYHIGQVDYLPPRPAAEWQQLYNSRQPEIDHHLAAIAKLDPRGDNTDRRVNDWRPPPTPDPAPPYFGSALPKPYQISEYHSHHLEYQPPLVQNQFAHDTLIARHSGWYQQPHHSNPNIDEQTLNPYYRLEVYQQRADDQLPAQPPYTGFNLPEPPPHPGMEPLGMPRDPVTPDLEQNLSVAALVSQLERLTATVEQLASRMDANERHLGDPHTAAINSIDHQPYVAFDAAAPHFVPPASVHPGFQQPQPRLISATTAWPPCVPDTAPPVRELQPNKPPTTSWHSYALIEKEIKFEAHESSLKAKVNDFSVLPDEPNKNAKLEIQSRAEEHKAAFEIKEHGLEVGREDKRRLFANFANNVICRVALGRKYGDGEEFKKVLEELGVLLSSFDVGEFVPWLCWIKFCWSLW